MDEFDFDDIADEDLLAADSIGGSLVPSHAPGANGVGGSEEEPWLVDSILTGRPQERPSQRPLGKPQTYKQTTLSGSTLNGHGPQSQAANRRPYRADLPPEPPTHHALDQDALKTWLYPTNLGEIRDYQYSIVKNGLFHNTLVALPTGLGKTFIAATIMLNFYRWTKSGKIIFVAPTKPLAAQQVDACLQVAGIPKSDATLLTGEVSPALREEQWAQKRVFFMTPQTLQNDLSKGYADPKTVVLLVVDEAHRATGEYAYVKVVKFIRRFNQSFRVLALTATPGNSIETVQEVIDNLGVSHVEIRNEDSIDLRPYIHSRDIQTLVLEPSDEMVRVQDLFSKALKPLTDKLSAQNIYWGRDPMSISTFSIVQNKREWCTGPGKNANPALKNMILTIFGLLASLGHAVKLLKFHGIAPFYDIVEEFRGDTEWQGGGKYKRQVLDDKNFQEMMEVVERWRKLENFVSHAKIPPLCERLLNHFMDAGESTRVIVFCEFRNSAEYLVRILNKQPMIQAAVFVGQADARGSSGMKQKQQIETVEKFKSGTFNVLVATSVGEEGLDIGQVDLIVSYDASASPIRMLQRMGRTGRKRAGNILLLLMKGAEEEKFAKAKDNYENMQNAICDGSSFKYRHDLSQRIVPRDAQPEVLKCHIDIPIENTQNPGLPEPKRALKRKKASKKKFNMPDGVETGFASAAATFFRPRKTAKKVEPVEADFVVEIPDLESVLLDKAEQAEFDRLYGSIHHDGSDEVFIPELDLCAHPEAQTRLQATHLFGRSRRTKNMVKLMALMANRKMPNERPRGDLEEMLKSLSPVHVADTDEDEMVAGSGRKRRRAEYASDDEASPPRRAPAKKKQKNDGFALIDEDAGVTASESDHNDATPRSSTRVRKKGKGARGKGNRLNANLEDFGDDCMRTSDMEDTDGSDDGADLVDFVVSDDRLESSVRKSSPARQAASSSAAVEKPFYEPALFDSESDGDGDEFPEIAKLGSTPAAPRIGLAAPHRRRPLFVDSDED